MIYVLWAVLVLAGLGLILGIGLAIFSKILHVKEDTRVKDVMAMLPGYNCGACGHPGCEGMAQALVDGSEPTARKCKPSKQEMVDAINQYIKEHKNDGGN